MGGLLLYNGFKDKVHLKAAPIFAPLVCFRVVTKGDYPELVKQNLKENIKICSDAGMENFIFEIVTEKSLNLPTTKHRVREIILPASYIPKNGAKFKARALQYCLEDHVNCLHEDDWIVHLDEDTLISESSVHGILNFCIDGKHPFGMGLMTFAHNEIVNWVADDLGRFRFAFKFFHKPLYGIRSSFMVARYSAEKELSFDHGHEGSMVEDIHFGMIAYQNGYSVDFIEGEMYEKSPFTLWDFLQQRKRWITGIYLTVHSRAIPFRYKWLLAMFAYTCLTMPFMTAQFVLCHIFPLPKIFLFDFLGGFTGAVHIYIKNIWHLFIIIIVAILVFPFGMLLENIAIIMAILFGQKKEWYVVNKDPHKIR